MNATTIGIDLAKSVFQVHGIDAAGQVTVTKKLRRAEVIKFFQAIPACLVGTKPAPRHISGPGRSQRWATRFG